MVTRFCSGVCALAFAAQMLLAQSHSVAADPDIQSVEECVARALEAETEGDFLARQRLLAEATTIDPEFAPALWQQGKVRDAQGEWLDVEASIERSAENPRLLNYERRRAGLPDNLVSHWSIAMWCADQGLRDQCRAHLNRVLMFDTDHRRARNALGFQFVGNEWISPQQISELSARTETATEALAKYRKPLQTILASLNDPRKREAGKSALMAIQDAAAVPAVEAILTSPDVPLSQLAIDWMSLIDSVEASQVLARYSLFHPADETRNYAISKLKLRPFHDFVPDLLEMISAPVSAMIVPEFDGQGNLSGYRQAFAQEKFDKIDFVVLNRQFVRDGTTMPATNLRNAMNGAQTQNTLADLDVREAATLETANRNMAVIQENRQIALRNSRVGAVIAEIADLELTEDPKALWDWWDSYNETQYQAYKPERYRRNTLVDRVLEYSNPPPRTQFLGECFVAGTQVTTLRGRRAIEQIVAGDLVLSCSVETGELTWKPVVRATTRPPEKTLVVSIGDEEFRCTTGHLFWVSGRSWQKASELKVGDILHAAREPVVVTNVRESLVDPTFNLQVADFGNYFVGKNLVLTHDVTPRRPTRRLVPGDKP
jgi:hypothetical protein